MLEVEVVLQITLHLHLVQEDKVEVVQEQLELVLQILIVMEPQILVEEVEDTIHHLVEQELVEVV